MFTTVHTYNPQKPLYIGWLWGIMFTNSNPGGILLRLIENTASTGAITSRILEYWAGIRNLFGLENENIEYIGLVNGYYCEISTLNVAYCQIY